MDGMLVKVVIAGVLGAHGLGHVLGWTPAAGLARFEGVSSGSWVLTGLAGDGVARMLAIGLFAIPTAGFVIAAAGILLGQPWWRPVAVGSAAVSLARWRSTRWRSRSARRSARSRWTAWSSTASSSRAGA